MASLPCDPKEHIERIRRDKFFIGRNEKNPLAGFLHHTVGLLSEELYSKDSHFIMELIQNAEDNGYSHTVTPQLEFVVTTQDITTTGAAATLLVFNNEIGFSPTNIDSICGGLSIKKGKKHHGYIGEKGIGFKSVFLVTSQPYVFSNGYRIRFNEKPQPECEIGYIVPEWVEGNPTLDEIQKIYGHSKALPTTIIILPLKHEKIDSVKKQLSDMHPETLLFLSKIKGLSVREDNPNPTLTSVKAVTIDTVTEFQQRKNIDAESYILQLASEENSSSREECSYYMWRQRFPVRPENVIEKRKEVEEWNVTLAFPYWSRLDRGLGSPGIYAYLPTEMVTNFPFIIQSDFILASSRENILTDNVWNKGILDCVPSAFVNALLSLVKSVEETPPSSLPLMFSFLPIKESSIPILERVRQQIKARVVNEHIMPCESYTKQKIFCKVADIARLDSKFWTILDDARKEGVDLQNLCSHGTYILSSAFDRKKFDDIHNFLGVKYVDKEWYVKCLESCQLASLASEKLYFDLLLFLVEKWESGLKSDGIRNLPLLKYVNINGSVSLWSINRIAQKNVCICLSTDINCISWLINWNKEFELATGLFFMPESTQKALLCHSRKTYITEWLSRNARLCILNAYEFAAIVQDSVKSSRKMVVCLTHFLFHSHGKYIEERDLVKLCASMPLVDNYGSITSMRNGVLVPSSCSKWVSLIGSNPWRAQNYVELSVDYMCAISYAGKHTPANKLLDFLRLYMKASDVPDIYPPNASFPTVSSLLTRENAILLLEWIRKLNQKGVGMSSRFFRCISNGQWLKTSAGNKPPSESFLSNSEWGNLLQVGPLLVDIPLIDEEYYDNKIRNYMDELKLLGVIFEFGQACKFIGKQLVSMGSSHFTRKNVISMLKFIKFLTDNYMSPVYFLKNITEGKWMKSSVGYVSPIGAILNSPEWSVASIISNLPFIDLEYYGAEICSFESELKLLGVVVGFNKNYQLVVDCLRPSLYLGSLQGNTVTFILECIQNANSSDNLIRKLKNQKWLKTSLGLKSPEESFLFNPKWECFFKVVESLPVIDETFYGSGLQSYHKELKKIGIVTELEELSKAIAKKLKGLILTSSITKGHTFALLDCCYHMKKENLQAHAEFTKVLHDQKWLKTCLGFRSPSNSILADDDWRSLQSIASLPLIDSSDVYGEKIYEYKEVLKHLHVSLDLNNGWTHVISGIKLPVDVSSINAAVVLTLLKCVKKLKKKKHDPLPTHFAEGIKRRWVKTSCGYKYPDECILFDPAWKNVLEQEDAPFIDMSFYGSEIGDYRNELDEIGVIVDISKACSLVAKHLHTHSKIANIKRIYTFLNEQNWKPDDLESTWIWIPDGVDIGEWVFPNTCILHDKIDLFSSSLHVLDKYYDGKLLYFFSCTFCVRDGPDITHYCDLWNSWEDCGRWLTDSECQAFWVHVSKHCTKQNIELVSSKIRKLPVISELGISLSNRKEVFIPDDLLLRDLLDGSFEETLFVWTPQPSLPFFPVNEFYNMYSRLGVQKISRAVEINESSISNKSCVMKTELRHHLFNANFFRIVLAFLADPTIGIQVERRLDMTKSLMNVSVFEIEEAITIGYNLPLSSGRNITVTSSRMFRWDKEKCLFFIQKVDLKSSPRANIEFASNFANVVSEGLLWEKAELIPKLVEIIRLGCLVEFDAGAIDYLLKSRNLQLFSEDEQYLSSNLSSDSI